MLKKWISGVLVVVLGMMLSSTAFAAGSYSYLPTASISSSYIPSGSSSWFERVPPTFVILDFGYNAKPTTNDKTEYYTKEAGSSSSSGSSSDKEKK